MSSLPSVNALDSTVHSTALRDAIDRSLAVVEFDIQGNVLNANANFLETFGYTLADIQGKDHRFFCMPEFAVSARYATFWAELAGGEFHSGVYLQLGRDGRKIWTRSTYNPIFDEAGKPHSVMQFATDITETRLRSAEYEGKVEAINRSQGVIEFDLQGNILWANANFLSMIGYQLDDLRSRHHSMLCTPEQTRSAEYALFWEKLARGAFDSGIYKRVRRDGQPSWIQATYNPILDTEGKPYKVVKFAVDITENQIRSTEYEGKMAAVDRAQAVIEFNLQGIILTANENFLATLGYSLEEVQGKHHRLFCEPDYARSAAYRIFWEKLGRGEYDSGLYKRRASDGRLIWIQATYNPIFDAEGRPYKVVKFASDVTDSQLRNADYEGKVAAIDRSQAVIEFDLNGTVLEVNRNFLLVMGY